MAGLPEHERTGGAKMNGIEKVCMVVCLCISGFIGLAIFKYYETRQYAFKLGYVEQQCMGDTRMMFVKPK